MSSRRLPARDASQTYNGSVFRLNLSSRTNTGSRALDPANHRGYA
jgi:hypothetical protein